MDQRKRTRVCARKQTTVVRGQARHGGELENVSMKGCLVRLAGESGASCGETVSIAIHLEPDAPELDIKVQGRVVREADGTMAVEFTWVELESFNHLFRLVQYNAEEPESIEEELGQPAFSPAPDAIR